jgi:hypothetical protein
VPFWNLFLLRAQVALVFLFGALPLAGSVLLVQLALERHSVAAAVCLRYYAHNKSTIRHSALRDEGAEAAPLALSEAGSTERD